MSTTAELFTIGQLARRTGVPARTIRFWSDAGLVPPVSRSVSGYRLYDAEAAARLDLVRSLRELGLGLDVVRAVLSRAPTLADVAAAHAAPPPPRGPTSRRHTSGCSTGRSAPCGCSARCSAWWPDAATRSRRRY